MSRSLVDIFQDSQCFDDADLVTFCVAVNEDKEFIIIEALAGTGKTTLLLEIIKRLGNDKKCLLLSFSKSAVSVARIRHADNGGRLRAQTFDSLFLHLTSDLVQEEETSFQQYRDMVVDVTTESLDSFSCKTRWVQYTFSDIQYVFVDEAQDTPPEAYPLLQKFRKAGKQVIITGDKRQAIFKFMNTDNLFELIPNCHTLVKHTLKKSRRCVQEICNYINARFGLSMTSARPSVYTSPPGRLRISIQCRLNATIATVYVILLSTLSVKINLNIPDGESKEKFNNMVIEIVRQKYNLSVERAQEVFSIMEEGLVLNRGPTITLSSVHRYKGSESDITVLAQDVELSNMTNDNFEENVKYVACTRGRYGVLETFNPSYIGVLKPLEILGSILRRKRVHFGNTSVSYITSNIIIQILLMSNPTLRTFLISLVEYYNNRVLCHGPTSFHSHPAKCEKIECLSVVGAACDVAIMWFLEHKARSHQIPVVVEYPELSIKLNDDYKLRRMVKNDLFPKHLLPAIKKRMAISKLCVILARYMVVYGGFSILHPVVRKGAMHYTKLQTFMFTKSVLAFSNTIRLCELVDYHETLRCTLQNLPPIIRDLTWSGIYLHGSIPSAPLQLRGSFDIVILDNEQKRHLIELKCVKRLYFQHYWQAVMYSIMCLINGAKLINHTYLWSIRDNTCFQISDQATHTLSSHIVNALDEFNFIAKTRPNCQFYAKEYSLTELSVLEY